MNFINPIELLGLRGHDVSAISVDLVRKAKRKVLAEIELSENNLLEFNGLSLTRSDCERVIDELENADRREFYHYLSSNLALNNFLTTGDERIFESFTIDSIYSLPAFVSFISPYAVAGFDKSLHKAFTGGQAETMRAILRTQVLIEASAIPLSYKSISIELENRTKAVQEISDAIKENRYSEDPAVLPACILQQFPSAAINALPVYFQGLVQKAADTINILAIYIWHQYRLPAISKVITDHILTFEAENVNQSKYKTNLELYTDKSEALANAPQLYAWIEKQSEIEQLYKGLKNKTIETKQIAARINELINVEAINTLPLFANEVRARIAFRIREIAVNSWNLNNDIDTALVLIDKAFRINNSNEQRFDILGQKKALEKIKEDARAQNLCWFCEEQEGDATKSRDVTLFQELGRSGGQVKYQKIIVHVPRCRDCEEIHVNIKMQLLMVRVIAVLAALMVLVMFSGFMIALLFIVVAAYTGAELYFRNKMKQHNIKSASGASVAQHPEIQKYIGQGWSLVQPTA